MSDQDDTQQDGTEQQATLAGFEQSLSELETLVEGLEHGEIGLEDALAKYERGIQLARNCQQALNTAELRVSQLTANDPEAGVTDLEPPQEDSNA